MNDNPGAHRPHDSDSHAGGDRAGFSRDEAEREARDAIGNARDELQNLIENQKNAAAHQIQDVAAALNRTADELRDRQQFTVATYVATVAERINYWSTRLEQRHIARLGRDMRAFANERPALFITGAVLVGFAATRFLKSSDESTSVDSTHGTSRTPTDPGEPFTASTRPLPKA